MAAWSRAISCWRNVRRPLSAGGGAGVTTGDHGTGLATGAGCDAVGGAKPDIASDAGACFGRFAEGVAERGGLSSPPHPTTDMNWAVATPRVSARVATIDEHTFTKDMQSPFPKTGNITFSC